MAAPASLPQSPGVYRFRDEHGRALYVGRATNLRRRVGSYWGPLRDRPRLRRMVPQIARVETVTCASEHEAAWFERNLLEASRPRWNRSRGEESPAYIRLETSPRQVGLRIAYRIDRTDTTDWYGPHLGGAKVRTAISALDRIHGLHHTASNLSPGAREIGRARRVLLADREDAIAAVAAVLGGDADAIESVRTELVLRRDQASSRLAFEAAMSIQSEIEALAWITSVQRARTITGPNADFVETAGGWTAWPCRS